MDCTDIRTYYHDDIMRFDKEWFDYMGTPINGLYEDIMEKSEMHFNLYEYAFQPISHLYNSCDLKTAAFELSDSCSSLFYINKASRAIKNLLKFYIYHKTYFVNNHRDHVLKNMKAIEQLLVGMQNVIDDFYSYIDFNYNEDYITNHIESIKEHVMLSVYGKHIIAVEEPNKGYPPMFSNSSIPTSNYEEWVLASVVENIKENIRDTEKLTGAVGIMLMQLLRVHHLFLEQFECTELIEYENFFTPLFNNMSIAFEGSRSQKKARSRVVNKLNKARGFGPITQEVIERVWKDIDSEMLETRLGKLWDDCGGDTNEFSRNLFVDGCTEKELTEFLSAVYSKYYLEHPEVMSKTKGITIQNSSTMVSNPDVNELISKISKAANVHLTVNVAPNGDIVGTKQGENYGDNYIMSPDSKVELPKK